MLRTQRTWNPLRALLTMILGTAFVTTAIAMGALAAHAASTEDATTKQQILDSPAWRQAMLGFQEWLSVQVVYDNDQVAVVKAQMKEKIDKMSVPELQAFLEDLKQKLAILASKETMETRAWAENYLTVLSDPLAKSFRKELPDVANLTAAQLRRAMYNLQQRRMLAAANRQAFQQTRDQQVAAIREMNRATANAIARSQEQIPSAGADAHPGFNAGIYAPLRYATPMYAPIMPFGGYYGGLGYYGYGYFNPWRW
jgi:hypothetical protein